MRRIAILLVLASCSKILGINDVSVGDGGPADTAPPNTVIGKLYLRCEQTSGPVDIPTDASPSIIQALLPDTTSPTGYRVVNGNGKSDGTFVINNVPDGIEYVLKVDRNYFVTSSRVIDEHGDEPLRCTPPPALVTTASPIAFNVTNMTPFVDHSNDSHLTNDALEVDAFSILYQGTASSRNNDTALNFPYDWKTDGYGVAGNPISIADATLGDDLSVFHLRTENNPGVVARRRMVTHLVDVFQPTGVTIQNGATTSVTGAFTKVTANQALNFTINRGLYDVSYDGTSVPTGLTVGVVAHPIDNDVGYGATLAMFDLSDWSRSPTLLTTVTNYPYADPFPSTWKRYAVVQYSRTRYIKLPGTTNPRPIFASYSRDAAYAGTINTVPTLLSPGGAKIAGTDLTAGGKVSFDGMAPVAVSWNGVATAKSYTLTVFRVVPNGAGAGLTRVSSLTTAGTSLKIPAEVFSGGQFFAFLLQSIAGPLDFSSGQLLSNGYPNQFASIASGLFRLGANCGDGVVKVGEEDCDTSGETATCDVDCTTRVCGDGLRNAAAGEACDTIIDTPGCNARNCTLPVCGDNYTNTATEDCDDGNTTSDGNGCGADCKFNNVCGNNVVEAKAEQCDPGAVGVDTATCDSDCTLPVCGDGHLNTLAGEQCDDANQDNTDHCDTSCRII